MRTLKHLLAIILALTLLTPFAALADTAGTAGAGTTPTAEEQAAAEKYTAISRGSNGETVKAAQTKLIELGYLNDVADGSFGNKTLAAVELFQQEQGFEVTGTLEPVQLVYLLDGAPLTREQVVIAKASASDIESVKNALAALDIQVTSAKVLVQSTLNKSTYPDMLTAVIHNGAGQTITAYTVGFLAYDANGAALQILTQYDENGYYEILGDASGITVASDASFGSSYGWRLQDSHGITYLIACVQTATFEDGTVWTNPIYDIWKEAFAEKTLDASLRA